VTFVPNLLSEQDGSTLTRNSVRMFPTRFIVARIAAKVLYHSKLELFPNRPSIHSLTQLFVAERSLSSFSRVQSSLGDVLVEVFNLLVVSTEDVLSIY
jgi:hypothetical protein